MIFASSIFLYGFLPLFLVLYYLSPRKLKSLTIAIASYIFYGWWRPDFVLLMLASTVVDYTCGNRIVRARLEPGTGRKGKRWLLLSCVVNLGLLGYFKYANFGIETFNTLVTTFGMQPVGWVEIVLPVGISFYTFQTMSYTIDVYRDVSPPVRRFTDFMCYVAMFPQLIAGPIVRYNTVAEQLHSRTHTLTKFGLGVLCFQAGMIKKVLLADIIGPVVDQAYAADTLSTLDAWIGPVAYSLQMYFDFSGYSDMAIGLGLMLGFRFPINFNSPLRATSFTDFWCRWHISLSTFLRDYLYIPLGGNQKGVVRTYINLGLTMLLGGLWHGAKWPFVIWGAFHGFCLIFERFCNKQSLYAWTPKPVQIFITYLLGMVGWVIVRSDTMSDAGTMFEAMFGGGASTGLGLEITPLHLLAGVIAAIVAWFLPTTQYFIKRVNMTWAFAIQPAFVLALLHLHFEDHVPFLYFQF